MEKKCPQAIRYSDGIKQKVVEAIVQGDLLLEEVMRRYGITSKRTVVRWLKQYKKPVVPAVEHDAQVKDRALALKRRSAALKKSSEEIRLLVVQAIVAGDLFLEEAMAKYRIKDREKVVAWLRKYRKEQL